jgi:phosphonate transport system permease protein
MRTSAEEIAALKRSRPRNRFVSVSLVVFTLLAVYAWFGGDLHLAEFDLDRRLANAARFGEAIRPYPIQELGVWDWATAVAWMGDLLAGDGWQALQRTLAISIAAIVLAAVIGAIAAPLGARNIVRRDGLINSPRRPSRRVRIAETAWLTAIRGLLIFLRAIPEYIWAFLLIKIFGFTSWPAVLALALHNAGILGKLGSETIEDIEPARAEALRALGATRVHTLIGAVTPEVLPRFLLYFFYRWETCVREATVLGMLGVMSLGSLIRDARAANFYDEMIFYVLLGSLLVLAGDLLSAGVRASMRKAA